MASYISSNNNRLYAALEAEFGKTPELTAAARLPAVKLSVKQETEEPARKDKTGTRTYLGSPAGLRRRTSYALRTYLTSLREGGMVPGYGPLFEAAMGEPALQFDGGVIASASGVRITFQGAHGLRAGQAVAIGGDIRFAAAVVSATDIDVNAPFSVMPASGSLASQTVTYMLGEQLGSTSLFDCWSPAGAAQRIVAGAAVDKFAVHVNSDYHEFEFSGPARDLVDSASFEAGQAGLTDFPQEPPTDTFDYSIVPGHLGQVWLGAGPDRFYTLTDASLKLDNSADLRAREFGLDGPRYIVPGQRKVTIDFELVADDDASTQGLLQASRQRSPVQAMIQLGQQSGQLFGVYMKSVVPEVPEFDDSEPRLQWRFKNSRAHGSGGDEVVVAFA